MGDQTRREFLKRTCSTSIGALGIGAVGSHNVDAAESELIREAGKLLTNGNQQAAEEKLKAENINYSVVSNKDIYKPDTDIFNQNGKRIATDSSRIDNEEESNVNKDTYKKPKAGSETETTVAIVQNSENNTYDIIYSWSLDQRTYWTDFSNQYNGCGSDAAALFWNTDYFSATGVGRSNFDSLGHSRVSYGKWRPAVGGFVAEVDDPDTQQGPEIFNAGYKIELEAVSDGAVDQNIVGQYEHTWVGALTPCGEVNIGISLGPFALTLSGAPYSWTAAASNRIPQPI